MATDPLMLVIEDDVWTRYALARIFKHRGWEVLTARTVGEGLKLLSAQPDCLILDLNLPDGCGEAVLRRIKEDGLNCRVVVCSAVTERCRIEWIQGMGADAILHKPVDLDELQRACLSGGEGAAVSR